MPNTITNTRTVCGRDEVVQQILIVSDGSEETDYLAYDSSAVHTVIGNSDTLKATIMEVEVIAQKAANVATMTFEYDASTDVVALPLSIGSAAPSLHFKGNFRSSGGIVNVAGAGATGDILVTTTGLDSGDTVLVILKVKPY